MAPVRALFLLLAAALPVLAAWPNGYTYKYVWTIQSGKVPATQSNFPLSACPNASGTACNLTVSALAGEFTSSSCYDAIWTSDSSGSVVLPFELVADSCNAASGIAEWWFAPSSVTAGMSVYLWVGKPSVTTNQGWPVTGSSPWDANFVGVYHMGGNSTLSLADSTVTGANGTNSGVTATNSGNLGGGGSFVAASSQFFSVPNELESPVGPPLTISVWSNVSSISSPAVFYDNRASGGSTNGCAIGTLSSGGHLVTTCPLIGNYVGSANIEDGNWHLLTVALAPVAGTSAYSYLDGVLLNTNTGGYALSTETTSQIGKTYDASPAYANGKMDELHISTTTRSANWIALEYNNQSNQAAFWSVTGPTTSGGTVIRHRVVQAGGALLSSGGVVTAVTTVGYSNARLGAQTAEGVLTPSNIASSSQFGVQCTIAMPDGGWVYHQPLIATNVGGQNLLIVATMGGASGGGNHLYAFAEGSCSPTPVWTATLAASTWNYAISSIFYGYGVGVLSTPVIDLANGWVFCVSASGSTPTIQVNKVRLSDGTILAQTTVDSSVQVPGVGCISGQTGTPTCTGKTDATSGSNLEYSPPWQTQRDALLLVGGNIYFGFGAGDENGIWHGWYLEYGEANPVSLQNAYVTTSGNGISTGANGGGIWAPGTGCSSDGTYIYCPAGNGTTDITTGGPDAGQTLLKLSTSLAVVDYLTPGNYSSTNTADADMECRPMLIDSTHIACASKDACGWIAPTSSLGHLAAMGTTPPTGCAAGTGNTNQVWQIVSLTPGSGTGVYGGAFCLGAIYYPIGFSAAGNIYGFAYSGGTVTTTPFATSSSTYNVANLACSSNGAANGILWAVTAAASPFSTKRAATLIAFNPSTLAVISSWTSIGNISKWAIPTVDGNGHVLVPTDAGIVMFGLL